jgi:hypothetical protein
MMGVFYRITGEKKSLAACDKAFKDLLVACAPGACRDTDVVWQP